MAKSISLIGHSHSVCLLDSLGEWREGKLKTSSYDERYSNAFQGWFANDLSDAEIALPLKVDGAEDIRVKCFPIFDATPGGKLVTVKHEANNVEIKATQTFSKYLRRMQDSDLIVSVLFGNEHARYLYINDMPAYDFIELGNDANQFHHKAQPIDRLHISKILHPFADKIRFPLMALSSKFPSKKIIHILPPPPIKDMKDADFTEVFQGCFDKFGQVDSSLRLKWYNSYCWILGRVLEKIGISVLHAPTAALTEEGFLAIEFAEGLTHGNTSYAELVWQQIKERYLS